MALSAAERDTVITRTARDETWTISSSDPVYQRKLRKIASALGIAVREQGPEIFVELPLKCVTLRVPVAKRPGRAFPARPAAL